MTNVELKTDKIALPEKDQLLISCGRILERLTATAPSDSSISMSIDSRGADFMVDVGIVSGELRFSISADAKSPFIALEKASKEASERIKKWSATKQVDTMPAIVE
ncbi:hypothetical protein [Bdellovibrio sp. GT3]|uniref:hypothetical protein n=1 Tax=unclassified Bdellovibrio TaxID=2633795 RepID=UPI0030F1DFD5